MDTTARDLVYQAQTKNVRMLNQARGQVNRAINRALRKNDITSTEVHTRVLALIFCAWVEANFSKLIHTPYGFTPDEVRQIKQAYQGSGLGAGWRKSIDLGLRKVSNPKKSNYLPNIRQKLLTVVDNYVVLPSLIRNKIAHGQWDVALNRENTTVNNDLTQELHNLDAVVISIWFKAHEYLANLRVFPNHEKWGRMTSKRGS